MRVSDGWTNQGSMLYRIVPQSFVYQPKSFYFPRPQDGKRRLDVQPSTLGGSDVKEMDLDEVGPFVERFDY